MNDNTEGCARLESEAHSRAMAYGVKANVKAPHRFLRMGSLCWVLLLNPGSGGEKVMVRGISRSGRKVDTWVDARDLKHFRAAWVPGNGFDRQQLSTAKFESRSAAQAWSDGMNEHFGNKPVRDHAAKFGRD